MNYMKQIAEMLGVELGEEFKIRDTTTGEIDGYMYRLSELGIEWNDARNDEWVTSYVLDLVLKGNYEIVKLPYKPKVDDKAFTYFVNFDDHIPYVVDDAYYGYVSDILRAEYGLWYRTKAEAEADLPRVQAMVDKWTK